MTHGGVPELLSATARELVDRVEPAAACVISRVVGDLLVELTQHARTGERFELGHEYLITDFPLTAEVIDTRVPRIVSLSDPSADAAEAALLGRLGWGSVLMLVLARNDQSWALLELYGREDAFGDDDVRVASEIVEAAGRRLEDR